jgi:hypothetical protein
MQTVTTIGFDIAKSVFQVHGVDAVGQVVIRRQLKRRQVLAFFEKLPARLVGTSRRFAAGAMIRRLSGADWTLTGRSLLEIDPRTSRYRQLAVRQERGSQFCTQMARPKRFELLTPRFVV